MKKVNEVFFGEHGLTSTSANPSGEYRTGKDCEQRGEVEEPELRHHDG